MNSIDQIFYKTTKKNYDKFNSIYFAYDGIFEYIMNNTLPELFCIGNKSQLLYDFMCDDWTSNISFYKKNLIEQDINIDFVISNHRFFQSVRANQLANLTGCPLLTIDHDLPDNIQDKTIDYQNSQIPENSIMIYPHPIIAKAWRYKHSAIKESHCINYGIPSYEEKEKDIEVCVIGNFSNQDQPLLKQMLKVSKNCIALGFNNKATQEYDSFQTVLNVLQRSKVCITASNRDRPPLLELIAAANNCLVITNKTRYSEAIFENEKSVMLFDSISDLKAMSSIVSDDKKVSGIAKASKELVSEHFNIESARKKWLPLLKQLSNKVYIK